MEYVWEACAARSSWFRLMTGVVRDPNSQFSFFHPTVDGFSSKTPRDGNGGGDLVALLGKTLFSKVGPKKNFG